MLQNHLTIILVLIQKGGIFERGGGGGGGGGGSPYESLPTVDLQVSAAC